MKRIFAVLTLCLITQSLPAMAWWPQGHSILAAAALKALPNDVPAYFRNDPGQVAHCAQDPDVIKNPALPYIAAREEPEHFMDYEMLKGQLLPATRAEFVAWCLTHNIDPNHVGYVPYAVAEWTERLTMSFAEARRWPGNPYIQNKSLVYAGILAHYAGDICMPLHTTVDYDGRVKPDGSSSHTGIHAKVDSLIEKLALRPVDLAQAQNITPLPDVTLPPANQLSNGRSSRAGLISGLMPAILQELQSSRALINRTYALESQLPPTDRDGAAWQPTPEITAFTTERGRAATHFIASLYLTAWRKAAAVQLPRWLLRETVAAPGGATPSPTP